MKQMISTTRSVLSFVGTSAPVVAALLCSSTLADARLTAAWVQRSIPQLGSNESFLSRYKNEEGSRPLLEPKRLLELKQQYEDRTRDYESRRRAGISNSVAESNYQKSMTDFSRDVLNQVSRQQTQDQVKSIRKALRRDETVRDAEKPIGIIAGVAAIYSGQPLTVNVSPETKIVAVTQVRDQRGRLSVENPIVNTELQVNVTAPELRASIDPNDPSHRDERFRFSLQKTIPVLEISSGVSYQSTSATVSASMSRQIVPNVTAVVDTTRALAPEQSYYKTSEQSVKLIYGIRF